MRPPPASSLPTCPSPWAMGEEAQRVGRLQVPRSLLRVCAPGAQHHSAGSWGSPGSRPAPGGGAVWEPLGCRDLCSSAP